MYQEGDLVLVYNYQLLLLPNMLRRRCPNATIGFFFDCPFPNTEFFRTISVRESLLNGVLESNLILFHHFDHVISFNNACTLLLGVDVTAQHVHTTKGRLVSVMVCPMGIDPARFDASDPSVVAAARVLQDRLGQYRIVTAVDRLDTIMGIPHKILAFEANPAICKQLEKTLKDNYSKSKFVKILKKNTLISTNDVINTNNCHLSICETKYKNRVIILSAIDNLIKGGAGQAIQNMNLKFNFPETKGL